jgi:hypothetical protein
MTQGERVWIDRVFGQGVSQDVAAPKAGLGHNRYVDVELDRAEPPPALKGALSARNLPLQQRLRLARRRSGRQLRPLAKAVGVSHVTLLKMEIRADVQLVLFWKAQGFRF